MEQAKRRGRPPNKDRPPMTGAEKARKHRERLKEQGYKFFTIALPIELVEQMERFRLETEPGISFQKFFEQVIVNFLQEGTAAGEASFYNELTRQAEEEKQRKNKEEKL